MKVLITGHIHEESLKKLSDSGVDCDYKPGITGAGLDEHLPDATVLMIRTETKITPEFLERTPKLKLICRVGVGLDHIDLKACEAKKIRVVNTPVGNRISTAEHTIGLIFTLAKKIAFSNIDMKDGRWLRDTATGVEMSGKTLLIIGLGNIGSEVAKRAIALGMKVIAVDPYIKSEKATALNAELITGSGAMEAALKRADFITFHVPLTDETRNMASNKFFEMVKPGSFLVNASRGAVIDEKAMVNALESGQLEAAALDVFHDEPLHIDSPLRFHQRTVLTPHIAGQTVESLLKMSEEAVDLVLKFSREGGI